MAQVPGSGFFSATATDVPTRNPCHATGTLESKLPVAHVLGECGGVLRSVRDQIGGEHMENLKRENQSLRLQSYLRFVSVGLGWVPCSGPVIPSFRRYDWSPKVCDVGNRRIETEALAACANIL